MKKQIKIEKSVKREFTFTSEKWIDLDNNVYFQFVLSFTNNHNDPNANGTDICHLVMETRRYVDDILLDFDEIFTMNMCYSSFKNQTKADKVFWLRLALIGSGIDVEM